ncbi:OmpA family protein [Erwinia sp. OLTSP20]|nr:OmpA family protein [Erwinia sp. OLTSP20]
MTFYLLVSASFLAIAIFIFGLIYPQTMPGSTNILFLLVITVLIALQCRYQLLAGISQVNEQITQPVITQNKPVILLLGPHTASWFRQVKQSESVRYTGTVTWLQITSPHELEQRLNYLQQHYPTTPVYTFFPFLPDDNETIELTINKLNSWMTSFKPVLEKSALPCTFAIYARLSNERRSQAVNNASWNDVLVAQQAQSVDFSQALHDLGLTLKNACAINRSEIQRTVMSLTLIQWMTESGLLQTMEKFFSFSALRLNKILLCDYGTGFTRHGAWSNWLEQQYAILPSLSAGITLPPLPAVVTPVATPAIVIRKTTRMTLPPVYWTLCFSTLLIMASLFIHTFFVYEKEIKFKAEINHVASMKDISAIRLEEKIKTLSNVEKVWIQRWSTDKNQHWGLLPYALFISRISTLLAQLKSINIFTSSASQAFFNSGSAVLLPASEQQLQPVITLAKKHPDSRLLITGHANSTGNTEYNLYLSEKRASATRNWLIKNHIAPERIMINAAGDAEPVASNNSPTGRQLNRRIEVLIIPSTIKI